MTMTDEHQESADLPRFAATREFVTRYGDNWAAWGTVVSGAAFLVMFAHTTADTIPVPFAAAIGPVVSFGVGAFIAGMLFGVLWAGLRDDARERYQE